jgi:hypothetical protein
MFVRKVTLAVLTAATFTGAAFAADLPTKAPAAAAAPPPFFLVNDNSLTYHYEFTATNPGAGKTGKNVATFTHFDVWQYGTNFLNVDWLRATNNNPSFPFGGAGSGTPAMPCDLTGAGGCQPYTEIYGFFRSTFGWNEIFNTKAFAVGPLQDISFMVGADLNTDNTTLGSAKRSIEGGIRFSFSGPYGGLINLTPNAYHEWQHDGFAATFGTNPSGNVEFDTTWGFEYLWVMPLGFLPPSIPLTFTAFGTIHGPKGSGEGTAEPPRTTEYYTQENLSLDVGKMFGGRPGMLSTWVGYRYWYNKFGINHSIPFPANPASPYSIESTWLAGVTMAF